jgi:glutathione S-transferase
VLTRFMMRILGQQPMNEENRRHRPDDLQLFVKTFCPFCVLVQNRMAALDVYIPVKNILHDPAHRAELVAGGGQQMVPCLRIESADGEVEWMYESRDIARYLLNRFGDA